MPTLDPHPDNELGKGIIDPAVEAAMLARGVVFALSHTEPDGFVSYSTFTRPVLETLTGMRDHGRALIIAARKEERRRVAVAG